MKKIISILICLCIFAGVSVYAETPVYDDIKNHWAETQLEKWINKGILNGYNGKFRPDDFITRGEFATLLNRVFMFDEPSQNTFLDLSEKFYTYPVLCLNKQGIINGYENMIHPDNYITREEAAVLICKALKFEPEEELNTDFNDEYLINEWSKSYMITLVNKGFFRGNNKGNLRPNSNITRAETICLLDNGISLISEVKSSVEDNKITIINSDDAEIKDCTFNNNVYITANIKNIIFENVTFNSMLHILCKTENSVNLNNCSVNNLEAVNIKSVCGNSVNINVEETVASEENNNSPEEEIVYDESDDIFDMHIEEGMNEDVSEITKPTIETTLTDNIYQRNSKKVFDVIARDSQGNKIDCSVRCNDINIEPEWNDEIKTSFTLDFQENGEYLVEIKAVDSAGNEEIKTFTIIYESAEYGEPIGKATVSVEAFTVGGGYIVAPIEIDVLEGVNCAYLLDDFLNKNNLSYLSTGSLDGGFYLATITDIPEFTPVISDMLAEILINEGFDVDVESYTPKSLSEFDFTQGSGWMYCVNGIFPNVGFSEFYLQDGDVMRIQFTLAYGSDIGGASGAGYAYAGDFYEIVNRDELTKIIAKKGIENCMEYIELITKSDMTKEDLDTLINSIK